MATTPRHKLNVGVVGTGFPKFNHALGKAYFDEIARLVDCSFAQPSIIEELVMDDSACAEAIRILSAEKVDVLIVVSATFSYGGYIVNMARGLRGIPFVLWGLPEPEKPSGRIQLNSLCGANVNSSFLKRLGVYYKFILGRPCDEMASRELNEFLRAAWVRKQMENSRICLVGNRAPGFYLSNVDELRLRRQIGPELVHLSLSTLIAGARAQDEADVHLEMSRMTGEVQSITATSAMLNKTARMNLFLRQHADANGIDGYAIKCWPELQEEYDCSICAAISRLNAEGIPTACEGDIGGLVTMMIMYYLTGSSVALLDLVNVIPESGVLELWHCGGVAHDLAGDRECSGYCTHPTMGESIGAATSFAIRSGPATCARLSELGDGYRIFVFEAQAEEVPVNYCGNTMRVRPQMSAGDLVRAMVYEGVEHHYAVAHDHIGSVLAEYAKLSGMSGCRY